MTSKAMNGAVANTNAPNRSVGVSSQQPFASRNRVLRYLKIAAVNIECDDFPVVPGFHPRTDLMLVEFRTTPGVFFFAIARLTDSHTPPPS
jgi:hypothetical protein